MEEKAEETNLHSDEPPANDIVHRELETIYGWIDSLDKYNLVKNLKKHNQNPNGTVECLRKRLKNHLRRKKLATDVKTLFPYYVVLDFEATCNEVNPPDYPHEIIEFPAVLVNTEKLVIVDHFQAFVKPVINPVLSDFCKTLTGISQEQVDNSLEFPEVMAQFEMWLSKHRLGTKNKFAMVTDGPWDMGRFLYLQCIQSQIPYPSFGKKWVNLRKCFSLFYKCERVFHPKKRKKKQVFRPSPKKRKKKFVMRLQLMIEKLGMEFEGHPHCGLDDARNIAQLLIRMIQDGASVDINERIQLRYKLDPRTNDENTANPSNQTSKGSWPVKPLPTEDQSRTYSQALKNKHSAAETMASLRADMKRHQIHQEQQQITS